VLLADKQDLDDLGLEPGTIKENVTVEGLAVMKLEPGTRLRLGDRAVLEVNKVCEPCFRMDEIRDGLRLELDGRRGMMTTVVEGGAIRVGDPIVVLEREELAS
jgi:MOSC domain-containing protein YiiM